MNRKGFTLLEVMVALAIMAVLGLLTAQAMKSGINNKLLVSGEINRDARLADALRIMRADIAQAFHYQDIFCKMANDLKAQPAPSSSAGAQQPPQAPFFPGVPGGSSPGAPGSTPRPCPPEVTGFIGTSEALYFTSVSNVRTIRDSQESDQAKIGYYLKPCKIAGANAKAVESKCLFRAISPILDADIDKPGPETPLVDNVTEFKLRYLGPTKEDYVDSWKTGKNGDDLTKDKFPYAVEITLTLLDKNDPKDRPASQTILAPIAFENNLKKKTPTPAPSGANPQGANPAATRQGGGGR